MLGKISMNLKCTYHAAALEAHWSYNSVRKTHNWEGSYSVLIEATKWLLRVIGYQDFRAQQQWWTSSQQKQTTFRDKRGDRIPMPSFPTCNSISPPYEEIKISMHQQTNRAPVRWYLHLGTIICRTCAADHTKPATTQQRPQTECTHTFLFVRLEDPTTWQGKMTHIRDLESSIRQILGRWTYNLPSRKYPLEWCTRPLQYPPTLHYLNRYSMLAAHIGRTLCARKAWSYVSIVIVREALLGVCLLQSRKMATP